MTVPEDTGIERSKNLRNCFTKLRQYLLPCNQFQFTPKSVHPSYYIFDLQLSNQNHTASSHHTSDVPPLSPLSWPITTQLKPPSLPNPGDVFTPAPSQHTSYRYLRCTSPLHLNTWRLGLPLLVSAAGGPVLACPLLPRDTRCIHWDSLIRISLQAISGNLNMQAKDVDAHRDLHIVLIVNTG